MREIQQPYPLMKRLCLPQKRKEGVSYRPSRHCMSLPLDDGFLLYQTMTGEMIHMTKDEWDHKETGRLHDELIKRLFYVQEDFDECDYTDQIQALAHGMLTDKKIITDFVVFTTMDCNARCFYCYELGRPRPSMSEKVARDTADYIKRVSGGEKVNIQWFGGEPLLNSRAIDLITDELSRTGTSFRSTMITNGWLFDEALVIRAKEHWHLEKVQISLDGTEETYNRAKAYLDRSESGFLRVMGNIGTLLDQGIRVQIRLNMNDKNADEMLILAKQLHDRFSEKSGLNVYPAVLMSFSGREVGLSESEKNTVDNYRKLSEKLLELGLRKEKKLMSKLFLNSCMADDDSAVTILPDGRIGKCEHESEDRLIGSIYTDTIDQNMVEAWRERLRTPACESCVIYPICRHLKQCEWNRNGCSAVKRETTIYSLLQKMRNTYEKAEKSEI